MEINGVRFPVNPLATVHHSLLRTLPQNTVPFEAGQHSEILRVITLRELEATLGNAVELTALLNTNFLIRADSAPESVGADTVIDTFDADVKDFAEQVLARMSPGCTTQVQGKLHEQHCLSSLNLFAYSASVTQTWDKAPRVA